MQKRILLAAAAVLLVATVIFGMGLVVAGTQTQVGTFGDSVTYYQAAQTLLAGQGLKQAAADGTLMPLLQFPPGYPAVLALAASVSGNVLSAARWVNVAAAGLSIGLVGYLVYRLSRVPIFAVAAAVLFAAHGQAVGLWLRMYSEPTYIALLLLVVTVLIRRGPRGRGLIVAGAVAAVAVLTRFAGVQLVGACGIWIVAMNWPRGWRVWLRRLSAFAAPVIVAAGGWWLRNQFVSGHGTSRTLGNHPPTLAQITPLWDAIKFWVIPLEGPWQYPAMLLIFVLWAVVPVWAIVRHGFPRRGSAARLALPAIVVLTYLPFLLAARAYFDPAIPFNYRLLAPIHALSLVAVLSWLGRRWRTITRSALPWKRRAANTSLAIAGLAMAAVMYVQARDAVRLVRQTGRDGMGYGERQWAASPGMDAVRALPADAIIYTNASDALYLLTARPSRMLPQSFGYDHHRTRAEVQDGLIRLHRAMSRQHAYVIYFDALSGVSCW